MQTYNICTNFTSLYPVLSSVKHFDFRRHLCEAKTTIYGVYVNLLEVHIVFYMIRSFLIVRKIMFHSPFLWITSHFYVWTPFSGEGHFDTDLFKKRANVHFSVHAFSFAEFPGILALIHNSFTGYSYDGKYFVFPICPFLSFFI